MAAGLADKKQRRRIRKELLRRVERIFEVDSFDYLKRAKAERHISKLTGLMAAGGSYAVMFMVVFTAWKFAVIEEELFANVTWIAMLPSTVIGMTTWMIAANRREYPFRQQARAHIEKIEQDAGMLWRFQPVADALRPDDMVAQRALEQSRQGADKIAIEDYIETIEGLRVTLQLCDTVPSKVLDELDSWMAMDKPPVVADGIL